MLTKYDELTCHQAVTTFDHPESSDRAWTEKLWFNVHDGGGHLVLAGGFGVYPNRNVMDAFACCNLEGTRQVNFRASRELRPRIEDLVVGPLAYQVIEPYRKLRLSLSEDRQGLSYDLELLLRFQPVEEDPQYGRALGRVFVNTCRYSQVGRARGWVKVDGTRHELDEDRCYGQRDHSWGIRLGVGAPEQGVQQQDIATFAGMMINWLTFQLPDRAVSCYYIERADGLVQRLTGQVVRGLDDAARPLEIRGLEHEFRYHERSARMQSGHMVFTLADGSKLDLQLRELTTMYLRGGGYAGYKTFNHGVYYGPYHEEGERWEVGDRKVADEVHGLDDTVVEVRCGDQVGYGIIENMILPPFPRYGFNLPPRR